MQQIPLGQSSDGQGRKAAIQKMMPQHGNENSERSDKEERVVRACKTCRRRKVRCSGDTPRCASCERGNLVCVYDLARRDRLGEATRLNKNLVNLLKDLQGRVNEGDRKIISQTLNDVEDDLVSLGSLRSVKTTRKRPREHSATGQDEKHSDHGEAFVTASVGSNEDLDFLDEDLMRDTHARETGYVGQNSEVQWLRSVQRQAERGNSDPYGQRYGPPGTSLEAIDERSDALHERRQNARPGSMQHITDSTFYLDSDDIEIDVAVDPRDMPSPEIAEKLFACYMDTVHSTFPLMPASFEDQFRRYIQASRHGNPFFVPDSWRATMNLLFAIGAKYSHLVGAEWRGDERDHLIYMTRAVQLLGLRDTLTFLAAPSLDRIQATGTLAFYFLVIGRVSRAWIMIGLSIRLALALGLHLRNEDTSLSGSRRESLVKTWWCLHSIECLVPSITGRPPVIGTEDCTVSLPQHYPESPTRQTSRVRTDYGSPQMAASSKSPESSDRDTDRSHYLYTYITLTIIQQKVLLNLYSPRTAARSWQYVQTKIAELLKELEGWVQTALPPEDARPSTWSQRPDLNRERFLLRIYYWSTKVLITRPCLCRIERRISTESSKSMNFNTDTAETCVEAARQMSMLFPEEPDPGFIYSQGPWWDVVHLIMQALAVLLLEMTYEGKHLKGEKADILSCIKKMIRWLRAMKVKDPVAARAHNIVYKILNTCAPALREQVKELIADDSNWTPDPTQAARSGASSTLQPQSTSWGMPSGAGYPEGIPPNYPPSLSYDHLVDPQLQYSIPTQQPTPSAFGNPFYTSFDQGAPIVEMQHLWWHSAPFSNLDGDAFGMNLSQQQRMHQQMGQGDTMEQQDEGGAFPEPPN